MRIFFSAGEPSGDLHAANLIRQLRARCDGFEAVGYGGPHMAAAGCHLLADMTALAVMWFARALVNLGKFHDLIVRAGKYFRHHRPDALVLVDYPGMNWWIARRAKAHGIPVFYYVPPQVWAWAQWRVRKMRRLVDHVLCCLPFEATWFRQHGCNATLVGHPFFDDRPQRKLDEAFLARLELGGSGVRPVLQSEHRQDARATRPLVTILPGSRTQEVTYNLPWLLKAAAQIRAAVPGVRFAVAAYKPEQAVLARQRIAVSGKRGQSPFAGTARRVLRTNGGCPLFPASGVPIEVHVGKTPELIQAADCCIAVSGSVSLELLDRAKPSVILYWISKTAYRIQRFFRKVEYITLVNLLAGEELFPEYLTCEDKSADIARHVVGWLTDRPQREALVERLERLRAQVGQPGASARAADYILSHVQAVYPRHLCRGKPH